MQPPPSVNQQKAGKSVTKSTPLQVDCNLRKRDIVTHSMFGQGQVVRIVKINDDYQLTIKFSGKHPRTLSYRYANLTKE